MTTLVSTTPTSTKVNIPPSAWKLIFAFIRENGICTCHYQAPNNTPCEQNIQIVPNQSCLLHLCFPHVTNSVHKNHISEHLTDNREFTTCEDTCPSGRVMSPVPDLGPRKSPAPDQNPASQSGLALPSHLWSRCTDRSAQSKAQTRSAQSKPRPAVHSQSPDPQCTVCSRLVPDGSGLRPDYLCSFIRP
jgi:hypothetical protein